jgi:lysophospholipase L1-like esterase
MGDSITLGVNGGYRNQLYRSLVADGHTIDFVGSEYDEFTEVNDREHDGHPGITTVSILDNFEDWLSRSTPPDVVLFMAGTNDLAWFYNGPMEDIVGGVRDIAFALLERLPEATVVVASIPPMSSSMVAPQDLDRSDLVVQFNTLLRASIDAARAEGHRVAFADVNAVLTTADLYDGIHPTREAHDKIAAVWYDVLSGLL